MNALRKYCVSGLLIFTVCLLSSCPASAPFASLGEEDEEVVTVAQEDLSNLAVSLSSTILGAGFDSVAIVDFTNPDGDVTAFEEEITERLFLLMSGFSGKIWVMRRSALREQLDAADAEAEVWRVMGIKAVIQGTADASSEENVMLAVKVMNAETSEITTEVKQPCKAHPKLKLEAGLIGAKEEGLMRGRGAKPDAETGEEASAEQIPLFPWPPKEASAATRIPSAYLLNEAANTLFDVAERLERALTDTGYSERSYYAVPKGFALVTRLEQIAPDGTPRNVPDRWAVEMTPPSVFSLSSYLKALFTAQEGHFRIIVFLVTAAPFSQDTENAVRREEAMDWLSGGTQFLPASIGNLPFGERHYCVAMIYEFEQPTRNHNASFKKLSALSGVEHLKKAQLWERLEKK